MINSYSLDGEWSLSFTHPTEQRRVETTVTVPSNIEPRLYELGIIGNYLKQDCDRCAEAHSLVDDWCYERLFDAPPTSENSTRVLVFRGIDTVAEIYLNGERVASGANMHKEYRISLEGRLKERDNHLRVIIRSAELYAREHPHDMFTAANCAPTYFNARTYLRKARHSWGWDNAPRLLTSGIWRSVYIEEVPCRRFDEAYFFTRTLGLCLSGREGTFASLSCAFRYKTDKTSLATHKTRFSLLDGERVIAVAEDEVYHTAGTVNLFVPEEKISLWWPQGFGDPKLYTARIEMLDQDHVEAVYEAPFGIRTLKLLRTPDIVDGVGEFSFIVNGKRVFIRGTNWKPLSPLGSVADEKTRNGAALSELCELNCNMVRVWGGGIYEEECFYDFCDRNGIMVWQDFMFACEIPPTDDGFCALVYDEASEIVKRYRNHPSLAVFCGDNENDEALTWVAGGSEILPSESRISREVLKRAVRHNAPYIPYVESSPFASDENILERYRGKVTHHQTEAHFYPDVLNYRRELRELKSLFIGETGPILTCAMTPNPRIIELESERLFRLWNAECTGGRTFVHQEDGYLATWRRVGGDFVKQLFGRDFSFDEWRDFALALNLGCAEIFKEIIEYCRANRETKTGVLWWSLIDMWEMAFNYSVIDSDGVRKLPYYFIKESSREVLAMCVNANEASEPWLLVANDTLSSVELSYTVTAYDASGSGVIIASGSATVEENSTARITAIEPLEDAPLLIISYEYDGKCRKNHFFTGRSGFDESKALLGIIAEEIGFTPEELR